jgi:hypothetical protein
MESRPVLLICGCQKYLVSLKAAIKRFANPKYVVIGLIGNPDRPTAFDEKARILYLQVEDTYDALPIKIQAAISWVHKNLPDVPGIFKTDEDIFPKSVIRLASEIVIRPLNMFKGLIKMRTIGT